jgi:hypothetical protein
MNEFKDKIEIKFIGNQYFFAEDGQKLADEQLILQKKLPVQTTPSIEKKLETLS